MAMTKHSVARYSLKAASLAVTDLLFFSFVSPLRGGSFLIIIGCALILLSTYWLAYSVARLTVWFAPNISLRSRPFAVSVMLFVMFVLLMQSIGQLSGRDVLAAAPLACILYGYISYAGKRRLSARQP